MAALGHHNQDHPPLPEDHTRFYIAETVLAIEAIHKHR